MTEAQPESSGYAALLRDGGFQSFLWTQFLAAFNDNVYKMIVSVGAVELAANQLLGSRYLALAGAVIGTWDWHVQTGVVFGDEPFAQLVIEVVSVPVQPSPP